MKIAELRRLLDKHPSGCMCGYNTDEEELVMRAFPALLDVAEAAERLEEVNTRVRAERHQLQLSGMDVVDATATAAGKHGVAFLAARDALAAALARLKEA